MSGTLTMKWNGEIGPAFIAVVIQLVGAIIFASQAYSKLNNASDAVAELKTLLSAQSAAQHELNGRLIRLETTINLQQKRSSVDQ